MPNNSASGGYLVPSSSSPLPGSLTLTQFIQSVIVGISGFDGALVRPKFQQNPPKQPPIDMSWAAFAITNNTPDANAYTGLLEDGTDILQRNESLDVQVAFYGPNALEDSSVFRDGFQIQQNLDAMRLAGMGFTGISAAAKGPDLINERWVERYELTVQLTRMVQRVYPILSFASARGTIHTVIGNANYSQNFEVEET